MPRLFTGIEIPDDVADTLAALRGGIIGARWIDPEFYHITLRFVGDIDVATATDLAESLDTIAAQPIEITLDTLDAFGGDKPRALVARVKPSRALEGLQSGHERTARSVGLPPERRKFAPHVTLARLRDTSPRNVAEWLGTRAIGRALTFTADRFVLYSSRDSVGGGPYIVEADYPLR
jgi:2'-5' RNA ligase